MKKKIFSILFALVLVVSLGLVMAAPAVSASPGGVELVATGDTTAEWTAEQAKVGSYSAKLVLPTGCGTEKNAEVRIPISGAPKVSDIDWSFWTITPAGMKSYALPIEFYADLDGDGTADKILAGNILGASVPITDEWYEMTPDLWKSYGGGFYVWREDGTGFDFFVGADPWASAVARWGDAEIVRIDLGYGPLGSNEAITAYADDFTLTVNGTPTTYALEPPAITAITVDDPNGGEFLSGTYTVEWSHTGYPSDPDATLTLQWSTGTGWHAFASPRLLDCSCEWNTAGLSDGSTYQLRAMYDANPSIYDMSDNWFTIDNTEPVVAVTSPNGAEEWAGGETHEITWTATDTNMASDPITIEYTDGNGWTQVATGEANDGTYSWEVPDTVNTAAAKVRVTAVDKAENSGSDESDAVFVIDSTVPEVTLTAPLEGAYINEDSCEVTATATDAGPTMEQVEFFYSLDAGASWLSIGTDTSSPYSVTWDLSELSDQADIQVKAVASDVAGNTSEDSNTGITLDRENPVVTLDAPLDNGYINDTTYEVTATATDATAGVEQVEFFYSLDDGETWETIGTDSESPYSVTWTLSLTEQAGIQVKAEATDKAGNTSEDINTGVTFDKTAPSTPADVTAVAEPGKVTLTWTVSTDALSGLDHYNIYRSASDYTEIGEATAAETSYIDTTATPGEAYTYKVGAVDRAGNEAISDATDEVIFMAEVTVSIDAPDSVYLGEVFAVDVDITEVTDFDAASFDVTFRSAYLELISVDNGLIDGTTLEVMQNPIAGGVRIVINLEGIAGVSGAGTLATLHFAAIVLTDPNPTFISLANGCLSNIQAERIVANWLMSGSLDIEVLRGDANSDGTLDSRDITKVERIVAGVDDPTPGADANGDGVYDARDITKTERLVAGA